MRFILALLAAAIVGFPVAASAECGGVFCNNVVVERIVLSGANASLRTAGDETLLDCDPSANLYLTMRRSDVEYEDWYALVLTAFNRGEPITIRLENGTGPCYVSYIVQDR